MKSIDEKIKEDGTPFSSDRECGNCRLCCNHLDIPEIESPRFEWCQHACESGCNIYESRPASCQQFNCLWKLGWLPDGMRPDKAKFVAWLGSSVFTKDTVYITTEDKGQFLKFKGTKGSVIKSLIELYTQNEILTIVLDRRTDQRTMIADDNMKEKVKKMLSEGVSNV